MKRKSFRRIYCLILMLLFLFGASFSANAGNGTQYGGVGVGYWTIGWNLTGGISHIHYSYNDNGGAYTYSTTSGINYKPRALFGCTSWDSALSSSIFTFTSTSTTVRDIRFEYVNASWIHASAWCEYFSSDGTRVSDAPTGDYIPNPTQDYAYVVIKFNQYYLASDYATGITEQANLYNTAFTSEHSGLRALFPHEVGHALGLSHITPLVGNAIMDTPAYYVYARYGIYQAQDNDVAGVNIIY